MLEKASIILIFVVRFFLSGKSTAEAAIYSSKNYIESVYVEKRIGKRSLKSFCNLSKEKKLAICDKVFYDINDHRGCWRDDIYLNKSAAYYKSMDCVQNKLAFHAPGYTNRNSENIMQYMFPCYGRNEPMRTNWNVDDNYDRLYVSIVLGSVFVYEHIKAIDDADTYAFFYLITEVKIFALPNMKITWSAVREELNSLEVLSYNEDIDIIEANYIREVVIAKETRGNDPVCDLEKEHKISLCEYILRENKDSYVFRKELSDDRSTDCEEKRIVFLHNPSYNIGRETKRKMYPCYGFRVATDVFVEAKFYLSGGYRLNSLLIYILYPKGWTDEYELFRLYSLVENVRVSYIPFVEQAANVPLDEPGEENNAEWYLLLLQKLKDYFDL